MHVSLAVTAMAWWWRLEEWMNVLTHAISVPAALYAVSRGELNANNEGERMVLLLYGSMLVALFTCSTCYHLACALYSLNMTWWLSTTRRLLQIADRSIIHLFIAACYTPWLMLHDNGPLAEAMCRAVWACAVVSIIMQNLPFSFFSSEGFVLFTYLFVAVIPGTFICVFATDLAGLPRIAAGGALYIIGLMFYCLDGRMPFAHAIWHCFVNVAALFHYQAIMHYLIRERHKLVFVG